MKNKILILFLTLVTAEYAICQNVESGGVESQEVIPFNLKSRRISPGKSIPFDKNFIIDIEGIQPSSIVKVLLFEVEYDENASRNPRVDAIFYNIAKVDSVLGDTIWELIRSDLSEFKKIKYGDKLGELTTADSMSVKNSVMKHAVERKGELFKALKKYSNRDSIYITPSSIPDYIIPFEAVSKRKVNLLMPPIKPNREFDILIVKGLSDENVKLANRLHELIYRQAHRTTRGAVVLDNEKIKMAFRVLKDSVNNANFKRRRETFSFNLTTYYEEVFKKILPYMDSVNRVSSNRVFFSLTNEDLARIRLTCIANNEKSSFLIPFRDLAGSDTVAVFHGLRSLEDKKPQNADSLDVASRIANLDSTLAQFEMLRNKVTEFRITDTCAFAPISRSIDKSIRALLRNRDYLAFYMKKQNRTLDSLTRGTEGYWLIGNTGSKDLQTKGKGLLTVDAGFTTLFGVDNYGKVRAIPRLFWGLNVNFRSIDKNIKLKTMARRLPKDTLIDQRIITRRSILHTLGLNVGFTLGAIGQHNFDNFYNNSSLMLGPSFRIGEFLRLSAGSVFMRRKQVNPLTAQKKFTTGLYISAALDFDLFDGVKTIFTSFFK